MSVEANKQTALVYHNLNPDDVEKILTPGFIGRHAKNQFTWQRENHKVFLTNHPDLEDVIHEQIAEGEWVATRFTRTGTFQVGYIEVDMMHFKRFDSGKIAEI